MSLITWKGRMPQDPLSEFEKLQNEINKLFEFDRVPRMSGLFDRVVSPEIDVLETEDGFVVRCDLPGVELKDLDVTITENVLTIKGEKKEEKSSREAKVYRRESWSGGFQRTLSLPNGVNPEKIEAVMQNGVLRISLPKREEVKPKQIAVKVS